MTSTISAIEWEFTAVLLVAVAKEFEGALDYLNNSFDIQESDEEDILAAFVVTRGTVLIRVLLAKVPEPAKGGDAASSMTARLIERYQPFFVGMIGFCAADRTKSELGSVIVASATMRHDAGKLRSARLPLLPPVFTHDRDVKRLSDRMAADVFSFLRTYEPGFRVHFGAMTSGNQVVRHPKAFDYLRRQLATGLAGDEYTRNLLALDMEAHAVAYAAEQASTRWMIVKGVADFADLRKDDGYQKTAIQRAWRVGLDLLQAIVPPEFLRERASNGLEAEAAAIKAFGEGRISDAAVNARLAFKIGRRSPSVRRRYTMALTQEGSFSAAHQLLDGYRRGRILFDDITRELSATMYWREGRYQQALELLDEHDIEKSRPLQYLKAMNLLFSAEEPLVQGRAATNVTSESLAEAARLLTVALEVPWYKKAPYWVSVNLCFTQTLRRVNETEVQRLKTIASEHISQSLQRAPLSGTPRLYQLLLYATCGSREDFDSASNLGQERAFVTLPLENLDMVYLRLRFLQANQLLPQFDHYWAGMCGWLRGVQLLGKTVREETADAMRRAR